MELNDVIKELEELKARVSELENRITNSTDVSDLGRGKWVATDENGTICVYRSSPRKGTKMWHSTDLFEDITPDQALYLCGRVPKWEDEKPTPVKR